MSDTTVLLSGLVIIITKATATQNEVALSYHSVRGLYFLAVVFVRSISLLIPDKKCHKIFAKKCSSVRAPTQISM